MSEYTPTTDEVRVAWAGWTNAFGRGLGIGKDEFDRWLAAHDAEQARELQAECLRVDEANTRLGERVCELEAENERLRDTARNYEIAMHGARGERDSALAEVERLWVNLDEARGYTKKALAERDAAREQARQRDEVLHWLIGMDEPESEARRTVTLTEIIRRARAALDGDGR